MGVATPYSTTFYSWQQHGSLSSAEVIVPLVLELFPCRSIIDVGCGVGTWLSIFDRCGVKDYVGIDGSYVSLDMLKIPTSRFQAADVSLLRGFNRRYDLACSLEVAEHLPESCAAQFVSALVAAAPVVLFSAAAPNQGGTSHINEQWPSYWHQLFSKHGYIAIDCIRPQIHRDPRVEWFYRQNILVYCLPSAKPPDHHEISAPYELDRVDDYLLVRRYNPQSWKEAVHMLRGGLAVLAQKTMRKIGVEM
jgi:SAM-dependent methyltransferase